MRPTRCLALIPFLLFNACNTRPKPDPQVAYNQILIKAKDNDLPTDSIIARHLRAIGGPIAMSQIKTAYTEASGSSDGMPIKVQAWHYLGQKAHVRIFEAHNIMDEYITRQCVRCSFCEESNLSAAGLPAVHNMMVDTSAYSEDIYGSNYYLMPGLLSYAQQSNIKISRVDNPQRPYYELTFTLPGDHHFMIGIHPESFLVTQSGSVMEEDMENASYNEYRDFERTKEGYVYPKSVTTYRVSGHDEFGNVLLDSTYTRTLTSIRLNPPDIDSGFRLKERAQHQLPFLREPFPQATYESPTR